MRTSSTDVKNGYKNDATKVCFIKPLHKLNLYNISTCMHECVLTRLSEYTDALKQQIHFNLINHWGQTLVF